MTAQPITPERYDTGPIVLDDANAAAARAFRANALAAGHAVAAEDGHIILPPRTIREREADGPVEVMPPPIEREVDLGADDEPRQIHITTRDGHRHTLDVLITVSSARLHGWYLAQMADIRQKLALCEDEAEAQELADRLGKYQQKQIALSVPNLPADLLGQLSTHKFGQLMETINLMLAADQIAASSPNGKAARS